MCDHQGAKALQFMCNAQGMQTEQFMRKQQGARREQFMIFNRWCTCPVTPHAGVPNHPSSPVGLSPPSSGHHESDPHGAGDPDTHSFLVPGANNFYFARYLSLLKQFMNVM